MRGIFTQGRTRRLSYRLFVKKSKIQWIFGIPQYIEMHQRTVL
jgi:hypothetical protein